MMAVENRDMGGEGSPLLGERSTGSSETIGGSREAVDDGKANQQVGRWRGVLIALSLGFLIFLQTSNMSGITTTQSRIAEDLDAFSSTSWFTSSYLIAMSSFSPLAARMSQIFSPRNCILFASVLFSIGGAVTAFAPNLEVFLLGRAISGTGGAGIFTISFVLVLELAGSKRRGLLIGLLNTGFTIGVSMGAVVYGALAPVMGWRFLFWIQSPLGLIAGAALFLSIPKSFTGGKGAKVGTVMEKLVKVDYLGALTLTASLVSFLFGLSWSKVLWSPIVASIVLLVIFVLTELKFANDPIIPVSVLKSRGMLLACFAQLGFMSARWMVLFYSPVYAIAVRGWGPATAGAMLIPTNLGFATGGLLVGGLHIKRAGSFLTACLISMICFASTLFLISFLTNPTTPAPFFIAAIFLNGLSTGATLNYALAHVLHITPPSTHFISTSLLNTFRGFAGSFGSAIGGGLFARILKSRLEAGFASHGGMTGREELVRRLLGGPALVGSLKGIERAIAVGAYAGGLRGVFLAGSVVALTMVIVQAGTGWGGAKEEDQEENVVVVVGDEEWEEGMEQGV